MEIIHYLSSSCGTVMLDGRMIIFTPSLIIWWTHSNIHSIMFFLMSSRTRIYRYLQITTLRQIFALDFKLFSVAATEQNRQHIDIVV